MDIDTPTTDIESIFALWYDVLREATLKLMMPNFALARKTVSKLNNYVPKWADDWGYAYEYPNDCLKILGIGNLDCKDGENYSVEGNQLLTDFLYEDGMPLRYIKKITDVNAMTSDFIIELSFELAPMVALPITQDLQKASALVAGLPARRAALAGMSAQENKPIRKSVSRFRQARQFWVSDNPTKK